MSSDVRRQLNRDGIAGVAALSLAGLYWVGANEIPQSSLIGDGVGAGAIPSALAVALALFSSILIIRTVIAKTRLRTEEEPDEDADVPKKVLRKHLRAAGMVGIGLTFLVVLEPVGYIPAIIGLALATAMYNGYPASRKLVLFAVGLALLFYAIFVGLLHIPLPSGMWVELITGR